MRLCQKKRSWDLKRSLGNEMVKDHFKKAIQNHKISHAYTLTGEAGMGRKSDRECVCNDAPVREKAGVGSRA